MGRTFITGDTHNVHDFDKIIYFGRKIGGDLNKDDVMIISGDFGAIWSGSSDIPEKNLLDTYNSFSWTTVFIDGNHENHDRLDQLPTIEKFGSDVGYVNDSVLHLRRGKVYLINGKKFFTFGGGFSIDRGRRIPHISWWEQELPSIKECDHGIRVLEYHNNEVDYVVTHTCPRKVFEELRNNVPEGWYMKAKDAVEEIPFQKYLQGIMDTTEFKNWFFGHFHHDIELAGGKARCLYQDVLEVE